MASRKSIIGRNWFFIFSILLLICGVSIVWTLFAPTPHTPATGDKIVLSSNHSAYFVNDQMDVLVDEEGKLNLEEVQAPETAKFFKPALGQSAFGLTAGTYWIRAAVVNQSLLEQWVLRLNNSVIEQFDLYVLGEPTAEGGQPRIVQEALEHFSSFYIHLPADEPATILMRIVINGSMIIPIELMDTNTFVEKLRNEYLFFGIYYGFVFMMAAYMFSMFIFNRMRVYLYYSLYIICFSISQLVWNGLLQELLGSTSRMLALLLRIFGNYEGIDYFFFIACLWFGLMFLGRILQLETYAPRMMIVYRALNIMSPVLLLMALFHIPGYETLAILYESLFALLLLVSTLWSMYRGNLAARYVVLAAIPFLGLAAPTILNTFSLMQESFLTHFGFQFGSIAEFIMFSIALSYQLRQERLEKENALQLIAVNEKIHLTRNEMLQNISHDIRSPLTIVQGGIKALIHGVEIDPGGKDSFLKTMYDKVLYINTFIDNLFELSNLEQVKERSAEKSVHFAEWISGEFDSFGQSIKLSGLQYKSAVTVDEQLVITIHSHEIRRVLANLIHNACKFSPKGATVLLQASSGSGEVLVSVQDEGEGIAPEHLSAVFNRSYKVDPADPSSGSGLGLAIAKEIVDLHRGRIWVESHRGKGSRFFFKLPVNGGGGL